MKNSREIKKLKNSIKAKRFREKKKAEQNDLKLSNLMIKKELEDIKLQLKKMQDELIIKEKFEKKCNTMHNTIESLNKHIELFGILMFSY
jgi:hypothetical protein